MLVIKEIIFIRNIWILFLEFIFFFFQSWLLSTLYLYEIID